MWGFSILVLVTVAIASRKHHDHKQLGGRKGCVLLQVYTTVHHHRVVQELKAGSRRRELLQMEECRSFCCACSDQPALPEHAVPPTCPRWHHSEWAGFFQVTHQSRKCTAGFPVGQSGGDIFSVMFSSLSPNHFSLWTRFKLIDSSWRKTSQHNHDSIHA